jgi:transposase InsO family protein
VTKITKDEHQAIFASAQRARAEGRFSSAALRQHADALEISEGHAWKLIREAPRSPKPRGWRVTEEVRDVFYDEYACAAKLHQHFVEIGKPLPISPRQLRRALHDQISSEERAFAKKGFRARRDHTGCLRWEAPYRNAIWQTDFTWLKVRVQLPGPGVRIAKAGVLRFIDCKTRTIVGWTVISTESSDAVLEGLYHAIVVDEDHPFGGLPDLIMYDNGLAFLAIVIERAAALLHFETLAVESYSPNQNGKIERSHQTLAHGILPSIPSWAGGRRDKRDEIEGADAAIHFDQLIEELAAGVEKYNQTHKHSALNGMTPAEAQAEADAAGVEIKQIDPELLRFAVRHRKECKVARDGVFAHNRRYRCDELDSMVGERVIVASLRHDKRFVDVYTLDKRFLGRATPNLGHSPADRNEFKKRQRSRHARQDARAQASKQRKIQRFAPTSAPGNFADLDESTVEDLEFAPATLDHMDGRASVCR